MQSCESYFQRGVIRIRGYQYHSYMSNTHSLIFSNKRNKLEIEAKVTIGVKWKFQAVAKIGQQITSY